MRMLPALLATAALAAAPALAQAPIAVNEPARGEFPPGTPLSDSPHVEPSQPQTAKPQKPKAGKAIGSAVGGVLGGAAAATTGPIGGAVGGFVGQRIGGGVGGFVHKLFGGKKKPEAPEAVEAEAQQPGSGAAAFEAQAGPPE